MNALKFVVVFLIASFVAGLSCTLAFPLIYEVLHGPIINTIVPVVLPSFKITLPSHYKYIDSKYFTITESVHIGVQEGVLFLEVRAKDELGHIWLLIYHDETLAFKTMIVENQ